MHVPNLTSTGSSINGITGLASNMVPITKGLYRNSKWFFIGNGNNVGV